MRLVAVISRCANELTKCRHKGLFSCAIVIFLAFLFLVPPGTCAGKSPRRRLLVLKSYHPTRPWSKWSMEGIESVMNRHKDEVLMDVEYMDSRVITAPEHYRNLFELLKHKAKNRNYDVIITAHVNAFYFLLEHRDRLYPGVPIVFHGVSDIVEPDIKGKDFLTGVIQPRTFESTVELATKLHPEARQLVMVNYSTSKGRKRGWKRRIAQMRQDYSDRFELVSHWMAEPTVAELLKAIDGLGPESIVFFTALFKDKHKNRYIFKNAHDLIEQCCKSPIYVGTSHWFGYGPVMGGRVHDGFLEGRVAARLAMRILNGQHPRDIPIVREGIRSYVFDYVQLKRFNIPLSKLPPESKILNKPVSFYGSYKKRIWAVTVIVVLLVLMIIVLLINVIRRQRAEKVILDYHGRLKGMALELSRTEERERRRIAGELSNRIGEPLLAMKKTLVELGEAEGGAELASDFGEIRHLLERTLKDARSLTFDLSPPILYEEGFDAAVEQWLAEQIGHKYGISTEFVSDGQTIILDEDVAVSLFRDVRELLFNVVKHAKAGKVKVTSRKRNSEIHVTVEDNGAGFDLSAAESGGFGFFSIRERLEQIGGRLEIDAERGRGTTVTVITPINDKK